MSLKNSILLIFVYLFLISSTVCAKKILLENDKNSLWYPEYIYTKKITSFDEIAKKYYHKFDNIFLNVEVYKKELTEWNKHLRSQRKIPKDSIVYITYPKSPYINYGFDLKLLPKHNNIIVKNTVVRYSLFYAFSSGLLSEPVTSTSGVTVINEATQNSPFTLGVMGTRKVKNGNSVSYSFYLAKYFQFESKDENNRTINFPLEVGTNLYFNYDSLGETLFFTPYIGIDFEKLVTFNIQEVADSNAKTPLALRIHSNTYGTIGISKYLNLGSIGLFFKFGYSKIILASSSQDGQSIDGLSGSKSIAFLSFVTKKLAYNFFYKQHDLFRGHKISINRYGFGIGFNFR